MSHSLNLAGRTRPMRHRWLASYAAVCLILLGGIWCDRAAASEPLQDVLQRLEIAGPRQFQYREKKQMSLLSHPWLAAGELFLAPGEILVAQQTPRETLTLITAKQLEHFDLQRNRRFSRALSDTSQLQGLGSLLPLFSGGEGPDKLQERFDVKLRQRGGRWVLELMPIRSPRGPGDITLSGEPGGPADRIVLEFQDGDTIEWFLRPQADGPVARQRMLRLKEGLTDQGMR